MRVGVYIDGFNLYFGARDHCGRGTRGWRWLDVRGLVGGSLPSAWTAIGAAVDRVVYCTARVSGNDDPTSPTDQNAYLRALKRSGSVAAYRAHQLPDPVDRTAVMRGQKNLSRTGFRPDRVGGHCRQPRVGALHPLSRRGSGRRSRRQSPRWRRRRLGRSAPALSAG